MCPIRQASRCKAELFKVRQDQEVNHKHKPYHHHDLPEGADASFFLCKELKPGYLRGATGIYQTPGVYYVDDAEAEAFDRAFPPKEKLRLPGQIF